MVKVVPEAATAPRSTKLLASLLVSVAVAKLVKVRPPVRSPVTPDIKSSLMEMRTVLVNEAGFLALISRSLVWSNAETMLALEVTVKSSFGPKLASSSMLVTLADEKSASPPVVVTKIFTVPEDVLFTVSKLSSAVSVVDVPRPSMSSKPTLMYTFCVPLTLI